MSVNPKANAYEGGLTVDPSAGGGVAAPIGALYVRMGVTPQLWQKFGALNTQWQQVALTDGDKGDITVSGGGSVFTIDNGVVTLAKMANMNTDRLLGRDTAGVGSPEEIAVGGGVEFTGATGIQRSALTGDVTAAAGSNATTIANNAVTTAKIADANVTLAKIQNIATDSLIGRDTAGAGAPENITLNATLEMTGAQVLQRAALTGDVTAAAGNNATTIANNAVTTAKIADANVTTVKIADANVTLAKIANIAAARILGSVAGGTPAELTGTQVTALLDVFTSLLKGLVPASGGGTTNFLRADGSWAAPPGDVSGTAGWWGSGVDGAATIGAGTTTLTTDKDYTSLVVQNTGILVTAGYCVRATGSITVDAGGNINNNGVASVGNGGGAAGPGPATSLLGGTAGANGGTGNGNNAAGRAEQPKNLPLTGSTSGVGGVGGNGAGSTGGTAGTYTQTTLNGSPYWLPWALQGNFPYNTTTKIAGGTGGGGGGGSSGASGASGGGGGAGIVVLSSPTITNNGAIEAKGGGTAAATGANAGSGGGGGGGKVIMVCRTFTGTAPDVSGGVAGAKTGTGTQGANGSTGYALTLTP